MSANHLKDLKEALDLGLGTFTRIWDYKAKDWVTSVFAADIDGDGKIDVIACSRDGRVHLLSREGTLRWQRIIGTKAWVGTGIASDLATDARIIVGTREGKIFVLNKDGKTITVDGQELAFGEDGKAMEPAQENRACWYDTKYTIRQITVDARQPSTILIGSEDRCAYGLDYATGARKWSYRTDGWVRAIFSCDVNKDGQDEILVGSTDRHLYVLDQQGQLLEKYFMGDPVHTIYATDVDRDGKIEILVATDGKNLVALHYPACPTESGSHLAEKWRRPFENRLLSLCVTDVDGDGNLEIISGSEDKYIYILDNQGNLLWRHNHKYRVYSISSYDIDNDGLPELLIGSENNRVRAMRIRLNREIDKKIRRCYRRLHPSEREKIADLTADERALLDDIVGANAREYVTLEQAQTHLNAREYAQALVPLLKLEQQKVERLWHKDIAYIRAVCLRHTGEAMQEIIVGTSTGNITAFNGSGRRTWSTALDDHIVDVQTGFIDRRRQEEIVVCSSNHNIYIVSNSQKHRNAHIDDTWMSSICVTSPTRRAEIIIGSENKKLYVYGSDLDKPIKTIATQEGVRIVRARMQSEGHALEIVTAGLGYNAYGYTRHGESLWSYSTRDHIRAIDIKDINGDDRAEVLVGSEDRNIHVLDSTGKLLWRYFLPHHVLAVEANDNDNRIFVGCADGFLYVFNREGELLWTYQTNDRIHAVRVADIDDDEQVEIIIGSEDQLEVLRVVNQRAVNDMIEQCWLALCQQQSPASLSENLLTNPHTDPFLQAFALKKRIELGSFAGKGFDILDRLAEGGTLEVRKALPRLALTLYPASPQRVRSLLQRLWTGKEQEVRDALLEEVPRLIRHDWELGFYYLKLAAENPERLVRRTAIRIMHRQIPASDARQVDTRREIFRLLLVAVQDKKSEWVRQEAARTLAHLLSQDFGKLVVYIHLFIVKEIRRSIWEHIAHAITNPTVKGYLEVVMPMLFDLTEENALERIQYVVTALKAAEALLYGHDACLLYEELTRLFTLQTIAGIANYQCTLNVSQFNPDNKLARTLLDVFGKLNIVSRPLKLYLRRDGAQDRQAILLEAIEAIDLAHSYVEQQYSIQLLGEPISKLPDHQIFILLLAKWKKLLQTHLNALRGKAELKAELKTKSARTEEQLGIWLTIKNTGRGLATRVRVTLLYDESQKYFDLAGPNTFETGAILPQEEVDVEFILQPLANRLSLKFDISYDDADNTMHLKPFEDTLELWESTQEFRYIQNPYSTGTPTQDARMFHGREKDMTFLKDELTREAKSVIVLYGQRRTGKTTVLLQLINTPILGEHIPVLIDLQRIAYIDAISTLLHRIAHYTVQALKKKNITTVPLPELSSFKDDPTYTFDTFLDCVEEQLAGRKLILLIDEFEVLEDQVTKGRLLPEIFDYLRNIVQYRQNINFLFAGTHKITEYTRWYRSIFFNIAIHHQLSRLSPQGAEDLIQKPVEGYLEYEPLTIKKMHNLTADQPYLIHLMCRAIVDYCNEWGKTFVTINDVNIVLRAVMLTGQFHFGWLWDQITPEQRIALAVIAEGGREEGRPLSFAEIEEIYRSHEIPHKKDYILDSLKLLIEADFIEAVQSDTRKTRFDSHKFRIPVGLTRSWLLKEHPLDLVRRESND